MPPLKPGMSRLLLSILLGSCALLPAGKTHTMMGDLSSAADQGLAPRIFSLLFGRIAAKKTSQVMASRVAHMQLHRIACCCTGAECNCSRSSAASSAPSWRSTASASQTCYGVMAPTHSQAACSHRMVQPAWRSQESIIRAWSWALTAYSMAASSTG
jgi:hypothetical protein